MLYGNNARYPKLRLDRNQHPEDGISPRLALAAAAANMILALEWADMNGYERSDDEIEISTSDLAHTITRMLIEIDMLRDMASRDRIPDNNGGAK